MEFFSRRPAPTCGNDDFRAYFEETSLPPDTCAADVCRCSGCWLAGHGGPDAVRPPLLTVLTDARARRPAHQTAGELRGVAGRIARNVERLLRGRWGALTAFPIEKTLRGEDHFFSRRSGKMEPLWPELVNSAVFGSMPGLRRPDLEAALAALEAADRIRRVADDPPKYRYAEHIRTEQARAAWAAAKVAREVATAAGTGAAS